MGNQGENMGNTQQRKQTGNTQEGERKGNAQEGERKGSAQVPTPPPLLLNFVPLRTTPELYAALTEAFLDKPLVYDPQKGMVFDPPVSPEYTTHVSTFKHSGRMINRIGAISPTPISPTYYHLVPFRLLMQNVTKSM